MTQEQFKSLVASVVKIEALMRAMSTERQRLLAIVSSIQLDHVLDERRPMSSEKEEDPRKTVSPTSP